MNSTPSLAVRSRQTRGSVLIVAMLLVAVIGLSLASYLSLNLNSTRLSQRSYMATAAMNLADTGVEEAVWSINQAVAGGSGAWTDWASVGTNDRRRNFTGFTLGAGLTGNVRVFVENATLTSAPRVAARATITPPQGAPVEKWVEVTLRARSRFANGLVAKQSITFQGNNASVDSWNSDPDRNPGTAPIAYSTSVRNDNGSAGSISVAVSAIALNNADIWGYAATGGAQPQVGPNGSIRGDDTPSGVAVDPARVSTDFTANFDPVTLPTGGTSISSISGGPASLGVAGTATTYRLPSISMSGNSSKILTIEGDVTIILTAAQGSDAMSFTGSSSISIPAGSSLKIYTAGNIDIGGNGVANNNVQPVTLQIWGTAASPSPRQDVKVAGNGALKAVVYAPEASVKINGNGDVMGSVVANDITLTGNAAFHYDESLNDLNAGNPFGITKWRELTTSTARATWSSSLTF
jgi:hypothetical protein